MEAEAELARARKKAVGRAKPAKPEAERKLTSREEKHIVETYDRLREELNVMLENQPAFGVEAGPGVTSRGDLKRQLDKVNEAAKFGERQGIRVGWQTGKIIGAAGSYDVEWTPLGVVDIVDTTMQKALGKRNQDAE